MSDTIYSDKVSVLCEFMGEGSKYFLEGWKTVVWYNGLYDALWKIHEGLEMNYEKWLADRSHYQSYNYSDVCDDNSYEYHQLQVLHMMLVDMYGDYGTSPRFGWIIDKHIPKVLLIIEAIANRVCPKCGGDLIETWQYSDANGNKYPYAESCHECDYVEPVDLEDFRRRAQEAFKEE